MAFEIPHSCTLPTAERPIRLAEFDTLLESATLAKRDNAMHLTFYFDDAKGLEAQARDLTARESSCCSFFDFNVANDGGQIIVGIGVPDQHASILNSLQSRTGLPA
ncbi:MAG: hypothetical protein ABIQ01_12800 [Pseudolysinimonas sp.]